MTETTQSALEGQNASLHALSHAVLADDGLLELAVIIPTYNEEANVLGIVERLERVLDGTAHEIIFVNDDSRMEPSKRCATSPGAAQTCV